MKKDDQKNDYVLMLAALLLLILSAGAIFWFSGKRQDNDISLSGPKIIGQAELTIDFGNGEKRVFEGEIIEGETLVDALNQAANAGLFYYQLDGENNVAAIESYTSNKNKSWYWYLDDKKVGGSSKGIILKSGDKILIKYE